jgi:hypothetical protein
MGRRNAEMKFAYSGPFASRKTPGLGAVATRPGAVRYTPTSPERYTVQSALHPVVMDALITAFGRSSAK